MSIRLLIKKGDLIDSIRKQASLSSKQKSPSGFIDNRLMEILQEKSAENANISPDEAFDANKASSSEYMALDLPELVYI